MPRFSQQEVLKAMAEQGLVPVFSHTDIEVVRNVTRACAKAGGRFMEFTNRVNNGPEVFEQLEGFCASELPDMITGVGTIMFADEPDLDPNIPAQNLESYLAAGANFVVGPCFDRGVNDICLAKGVPYAPGCMTPTEIKDARLAGASAIKIFPGDFLKAAYLKDVVPALRRLNMNIMVTGGVDPTEESLRGWMEVGANVVGMGSKLIRDADVKAGNWDEITRRVAYALATIRTIREELEAKMKK